MFLFATLWIVKVAQQELYMLYCELYAKFGDSTFYDFNVIVSLTNTNLFME